MPGVLYNQNNMELSEFKVLHIDVNWDNFRIEADKSNGQFSSNKLLVQVKTNELEIQANYKLPGIIT